MSMDWILHSKDIEWQTKEKKKRPYNILPARDLPEDKEHTQIESEGMEKDISYK